ncbi:hypothetical protein L917_06092 [Phytophthora nicotianae]|uniref:Uncharacterized protein n=1 Tax=Phytophthora nicotianae TaxID=4792 RepID=W2LG37_PHYNI|nr:hypothetical protein L917_06092 [Phytophthora nicotianae]
MAGLFRNHFDSLKSGCNIVVTGNPGIGKSNFYLYYIRELTSSGLFDDSLLVLNYEDEYLQCCWITLTFYDMTNDEVYNARKFLKAVRLIEGGSNDMRSWRWVSIAFVHPDWKKFGNNAYRYTLPLWNKQELIQFNNLLDESEKLSEEELMNQCDEVGELAVRVFCSWFELMDFSPHFGLIEDFHTAI